MPNELKPCPFCGTVEGLYPTYRFPGPPKSGPPFAIDCVGCGMDFTPREGMDVFEAWNRRAAPSDAERHERAVAWLIETMHGDRVVSAEVTFIPSVAERNESAGYCVTPLYTAPPPPAAVQEPVAVKVKPLDWSREPPYFVARVFGNVYAVEAWDGGATLSGIGIRRDFSTFKEAKDAAQADYEQRIRSALSASQSDPAPDIAALRAENERLQRIVDFVIRWAWRTDPPNAVRTLTDGERLSAIKYYPDIKRAAIAPEQEGAGE